MKNVLHVKQTCLKSKKKKKDDCPLPCKTLFLKKLIFLCVLDRFNVLISQIILKKIKKILF